jgi:hypothetical protein
MNAIMAFLLLLLTCLPLPAATLTFSKGADSQVSGLSGCDEIALAIGPDNLPRIAAHRAKEVWYARQTAAGKWLTALVAKAATDGAVNSLPVVDVYAISIASGPYGDVVAGRGRTKGQVDQTFHGPWITVIPAGDMVNPGRIQPKLFTSGACKVIFDNPARPYALEVWSKNGAYRIFDIRNSAASPDIGGGTDPIGLTGEKLAVAPGGVRAMGGAPTMDPSAVIRRGGSKTATIDGNAYPSIGDDMAWPGLGCIPYAVPRVYFSTVINGRMLANRVRNGVAAFPPSKLPSIGDASHTPRHNPPLVASKWRMAAFWTVNGQIVAVDVDGSLGGRCTPSVLCAGDRAAAVKWGGNIALAVLRNGQIYFAKVTTRKVAEAP